MTNKLLFTAAVAIGGLLVGGVGASFAHAPTPTPSPAGKPSVSHQASAAPVTSGHVVRLRVPATVGSPGTPATNDKFAGALSASSYPEWSAGLDNRDATIESGEPTSLSELTKYRVHNSVWAVWKAPASGTVSISTVGTAFDTSLAVFTGSTLKTAKRVAWNDDSADSARQSHIVSFGISKGGIYHIQVGSAISPSATDPNAPTRTGAIPVTFKASFVSPSNDDIRTATAMSGTAWTATGFTGGSTIERDSERVDNPDSASAMRVTSIWYRWTALAGGTMTVTAPSGISADYQAIYSASQYRTFEQAYYNNGDVGAHFTNLPIVAGTTYYFQLGESVAGFSGRVSLSLQANYSGPIISSISPSRGSHKGGTKVTITGKHLTGLKYLYWDIVPFLPPSFTVVSDTRVTFRAPAGTKGSRVPVYVIGASNLTSAVTSASHFLYS